MKGKLPIAISENHRRGIESTLGLLDEMLCRFEQWARGSESRGVLYEEHNSLTARQRKQILGTIVSIREVMKTLRDDLNLEGKVQDVRTAIWSQSASFWEALVELESPRLKRYGDLPAGFAEYFDPKVDTLIELLRGFSETVQRPAKP
jgi:hypothetical protein